MTQTATFIQLATELNDLLCVINLLNWDARTQMPVGGSGSRAGQLATLSALAREKLLDPKFERAAWDAQDADASDRAASQALDAIHAMRRVPEALTRQLAQHRSEAQDVWARAKAENNFAAFAPALEKMVDLNRQLAEALGYQGEPYDALLNLYEPGLTTASLLPLFARLREHHVGLLGAIQARPEPRSDFLTRFYPAGAQRDFSLKLAQMFGYDLTRGRLDESAHPFEISFTRQDVRITTRIQENFLPGALFGTLHETGHALYEQGVSPDLHPVLRSDLVGLYAVAGASYGLHESQSRLWENRIGRSKGFWANHFAALQAAFPDALNDVDAETFHRAVNRVRPSLIRVEADELTYDLHIMLRVELERALLSGDLTVRDVPDAWNARIRDDLGLEVPDDAHGALQDIHWSAGLFGSFPTYTLGNVMASQFYAAAQLALPELDVELDAGNYAPLRHWLTEQIYQYGRTYTPHELLERVTGSGLDPEAYFRYLDGKFGAVYGL